MSLTLRNIFRQILRLDGPGSGLDADVLDGREGVGYLPFGTGADGAFVWDAADGRWEDGGGNARATSGGNWSVAGATLTFQREIHATEIDVGGGAVLMHSADGQMHQYTVHCTGTYRVRGGGVARAGLGVNPSALSGFTGAVRRTTAGAGNASGNPRWINGAGKAGLAGAGGGDSRCGTRGCVLNSKLRLRPASDKPRAFSGVRGGAGAGGGAPAIRSPPHPRCNFQAW